MLPWTITSPRVLMLMDGSGTSSTYVGEAVSRLRECDLTMMQGMLVARRRYDRTGGTTSRRRMP